MLFLGYLRSGSTERFRARFDSLTDLAVAFDAGPVLIELADDGSELLIGGEHYTAIARADGERDGERDGETIADLRRELFQAHRDIDVARAELAILREASHVQRAAAALDARPGWTERYDAMRDPAVSGGAR